MSLAKITKILENKLSSTDSALIGRAYNFLNKEISLLITPDKKIISEYAKQLAELAAQKNASADFIIAGLFAPLAKEKPELTRVIEKNFSKSVEIICHSMLFAMKKLEPDNKDVFMHSFRTAARLSNIKVGTAPICAALLHELTVHTQTTLEMIKKEFSGEISELIEKFLRIRVIKTSNNSQYSSHLREMIVAMAADLRVIIIKMCSNIDRLEIYGAKYTPTKLAEIASESMELLSPLADLLGIWDLRWQLEDHAFRILQPEEYRKILLRFNLEERKNREKYIQKAKNVLEKELKEADIKAQITGRFKHFYSIYSKMLKQKKSFNEICDVFALRVIVGTIDDCYRVLGIIHRLWKPKVRRIKDYIATPKNNGYQSLHTTVFGMNGHPTEFQIRTQEMDDIDNFGIAAHWYYKNPRKKTPEWVQELLSKQKKVSNDEDFINQFSTELLQHRIYVYSPKGDVISLPQDSTPVDFAYKIHTEVGNKCAGAIVNDNKVPLNIKLNSSDVVEIILDRTQPGPRPEWLTFVKAPETKKQINDFLNKRLVE